MTKTKRLSLAQIRVIYIGITFFLIALSFYVYIQIDNLINSSDLINHTNQVTLSLQKISNNIIEAETNQRGFLLTGNKLLLNKRDAAFARLALELPVLDGLVLDNPVQKQNLQILHQDIEKKLASMQKVLQLYTEQQLTVEFKSSILEGMSIMDEAKKQINKMSETELRLLKSRTEKYNWLSFITPFFIVVLFLGALFILFLSYTRLNNALHESQQLYQSFQREKNLAGAILNSSIDMIVVYDIETRFMYYSKTCEDFFGKKSEEIMGRKLVDVFPELNGNKSYDDLLRAIGGETIHNETYYSAHWDRYFENFLTPLRTADQKIYAVLAVAHDNTDIIHAAEKLKQTNQALAEAQRLAQIGSWEWDISENRLSWSSNMYALYGIPEEEEITFEKFTSLLHPEDKEFVVTGIMDALQTGEFPEFDHRIITPDGIIKNMHARGKIIKDKNNVILKMIGTGQDITLMVQNENLLEQTNRRLEEMNKELQSFAYISSHDLQEPLRKIQTFATRILDKEVHNLSDTGKDYFNRIQNSAHRMQVLIEDLLAYSRTSTNERIFERMDLGKIVTEVKDNLQEELQQQQAVVDFGELCTANIIPFQFRQLIYNLFSNAIKFADPERTLNIKIRAERINGSELKGDRISPEKDYCHLSFEDNGIGFEEKYSEKIFEVFQRLHGQTYKGTGIGLAIVHKIVENHNGIIKASGALGKGARFDIYLPLS